MSRIRCFVAISPTPDVRRRIATLTSGLQSIPSDVKWEPPEKLHITLRFLGSLEESAVQEVVRRLVDELKDVSRFEFAFDGLGAFPSLERPKIFWIGASEHSSFSLLHSIVGRVATSTSIAIDEQRFHPHATIGRAKSSKGLHRLTATLKNLTLEPIIAQCSDVCVMKSELHAAGSRYSIVESIPLKL